MEHAGEAGAHGLVELGDLFLVAEPALVAGEGRFWGFGFGICDGGLGIFVWR